MEDLILIAVMLALTYATSAWMEKRHLKRLCDREEALLHVPFTSDVALTQAQPVRETRMVSGSCVLGASYFKTFVAGFVNFFGGSIAVYESLTNRARREALLRMREAAGGADMVVRARVEMTELGPGQVEAVAYGTAVTLDRATA